MPLQDHFHPPLSLRRHWHSFHNSWATYFAADLNQQLPPGYFAEANVQFGIEIDVATFDETQPVNGNGSASQGWRPGPPLLTLPFTPATDLVEVAVFRESGGPTLAAAVELISPANKDRPESRDAFVSKCATYLYEGVGLIVADVVTERRFNLHDALLARLVPGTAAWGVALYAVSYHPAATGDQSALNLWPEELRVGDTLPSLPLWLRGGLCLPLDLEAAYTRTCREHRLTAESL
jgi:Protein of unknown function (DUF4058)